MTFAMKQTTPCDTLASGRCAGASIPKAARRPLFPSPEMPRETFGTFNVTSAANFWESSVIRLMVRSKSGEKTS